MNASTSLLSRVFLCPLKLICKIWSWLTRGISGGDLIIVCTCHVLVLAGFAVAIFLDYSLYSRQFLILTLIITGAALGLCSAARARVWTIFLFVVNILVWAYETYKAATGVSG